MEDVPIKEVIEYLTAVKGQHFTVGDWDKMTPEEQSIYEKQ